MTHGLVFCDAYALTAQNSVMCNESGNIACGVGDQLTTSSIATALYLRRMEIFETHTVHRSEAFDRET